MKLAIFILLSCCISAAAFAPTSYVVGSSTRSVTTLNTDARSSPSPQSALKMIDPSVQESMSMLQNTFTADMSSSSMMISETEAWVAPLSSVLGPFLNIFSFAMLCRVVISWYPSTNLNELPFNIVVWPTEPLLKAIRGSIPPAFGVDITPIVWLAVFSFFNEILLGQQGLLTMKMKYGI